MTQPTWLVGALLGFGVSLLTPVARMVQYTLVQAEIAHMQGEATMIVATILFILSGVMNRAEASRWQMAAMGLTMGLTVGTASGLAGTPT